MPLELAVDAEVRAKNWRETINRKLGNAEHHLLDLQQSEQPEWNGKTDAPRYAGNLVREARGVYQVTETLVERNCKAWPGRGKWEKTRRTTAEHKLRRDTRNARVNEEHGEGVYLIVFEDA